MSYVRPSADLPTDPAYVYHATNTERAFSIASEGLKPHRAHEFTEQDVWPDGGTERRVYFSPKADNVWQFAPEDGVPVILRVARVHVKLGRDGTGDVFTRKRVPPKHIEILTENGWLPISKPRDLGRVSAREGIVSGSKAFRSR